MPEYDESYSKMPGLGKYAHEELARRGLAEADSHFLFNLEDKGQGSSRPSSSASGEQKLREQGFIEPTTDGLRKTSESGARFVDYIGELSALSNAEDQARGGLDRSEEIRSTRERVDSARKALDDTR